LAGREQLSIGQQPLQHLSSIDSAEDIKFWGFKKRIIEVQDFGCLQSNLFYHFHMKLLNGENNEELVLQTCNFFEWIFIFDL